jgi:6-phosphogluconolactonase (cycloisomerase 2 family)
MANNKDFIVNNAVEIGGSVKVGTGTITSGSEGYYLLSGAIYDSVSFSVSSQTGTMQGFRFGDSGAKVYVASASDATIYQYDLSTAYDISTASYASKSFLASSQSTNSYAVDFKSDGTKMYILGLTNDTVYQYSLSTAWDVSTASYDSVSFSVTSQEATPAHVEFKTDGTSFYIVGVGNDTVYQYDLTTAWDLSSASYASKSMATGLTNPYHFTFKPDGTKIFISEAADIITQFSLTTAWDISTGSTDSVTFDVSSQVTGDVAIQFNSDGTKLIAGGDGADALHQYSTSLTTKTLDLSTGNYFSVTTDEPCKFLFSNPAEGQTFHLEVTTNIPDSDYYGLSDYALVAPDGGPDGFSVGSFKTGNQTTAGCFGLTFKPDGFKMYVLDNGTDTVYQYSLSDPWDVTGAIYDSKSFSTNSQDVTPYGIAFKPDGTKMYILGRGGGDVYEYDLSTAWDVSTAAYNSVVFAIDGQAAAPQTGLDFSPDGTKMYVMDNSSTSSDVYQYTLSTAWDLSTASYASKTFAINDGFVGDFHISQTNGRYAFYTNYTDDRVEELKLSTPYDISTATKTGNLYNLYGPFYNTMISANLLNPAGLYFKPDGSRFFVWNDFTNDSETEDGVFQFDVPDYFYNAPLTWPSNVEWSYEEVEVTPLAPSKEVYTFTTRDTGTTYIGSKSVYGLS